MLYVVRGKCQNNDRVLRVRAESAAEAEKIGWKKGLFVTEVTEVAGNDPTLSRLDRVAEVLWKVWRHAPRGCLKAFGRPVSNAQAATLVLLGVLTWIVDMHVLIMAHA
jgi:hypothetical protein